MARVCNIHREVCGKLDVHILDFDALIDPLNPPKKDISSGRESGSDRKRRRNGLSDEDLANAGEFSSLKRVKGEGGGSCGGGQDSSSINSESGSDGEDRASDIRVTNAVGADTNERNEVDDERESRHSRSAGAVDATAESGDGNDEIPPTPRSPSLKGFLYSTNTGGSGSDRQTRSSVPITTFPHLSAPNCQANRAKSGTGFPHHQNPPGEAASVTIPRHGTSSRAADGACVPHNPSRNAARVPADAAAAPDTAPTPNTAAVPNPTATQTTKGTPNSLPDSSNSSPAAATGPACYLRP
ncbi:hypothetical protein VTI74DRAFT_3551 [Chaetomium olivicolor]